MKRILILLIVVAIAFSGCDYLRKKGIIGNKTQMKEYIERLENTIKDDSLEFAAQLEKIKKDAQFKVDSVKSACGTCEGNYFVITGSFKEPKNADNFVAEMAKLGYKAEIVDASNGFRLVSVFCGKSLSEVSNALTNIRTNVNGESWVYMKD